MTCPPTASWTRTAFGIDENGGNPIVVKAVRRGSHVSFDPAGTTDLTTAPAGQARVACLLQRESFLRRLTAPLTSARKAISVFPSLLDVQLPFSVEDCEISILETQPTPDRTGTQGLVAGVRRTALEKRLASLRAAGIGPHLLDQEALALWTQLGEEFPSVPGDTALRVVIYLGADRVSLVTGLGDEFAGAQSMSQMDPEGIERFLKSLFPSVPVTTQWFWAGPGATDQHAVETRHAALATKRPGILKVVREPATYLARALAARALTPGPARCNLMTGPFIHPLLRDREHRRPYRWAIATLAAGLLLCAVNIAWQIAVQQRIAAAQLAVKHLASEVVGSRAIIPFNQELLTAQRTLEAQARDMEPFLIARASPVRDAVQPVIAAAHAGGVLIEALTFGRDTLVAHGSAATRADAEKFAKRLNGNGWSAVLEHKESPGGGDRAAFVIVMKRTREK